MSRTPEVEEEKEEVINAGSTRSAGSTGSNTSSTDRTTVRTDDEQVARGDSPSHGGADDFAGGEIVVEPWNPPGSFAGTGCVVPTLRECQDADYLASACGQAQQEIENVTTPGSCAKIMHDAMMDLRDAAEPGTVPFEMQGQGVARVIGGGPLGMAYDEDGDLISPDSHYDADPLSIESQYIAAEYGNPIPRDAMPNQLTAGDVYDGWAMTNSFMSCAEYAYEQGYELNEYLRAYASGDHSNLRAVEIAFGDASDPESFGTRHLDDLDVRNIAGVPVTSLTYDRFPANGVQDIQDPKNSFFWLPPHQHASEIPDPGPDLFDSLRAASNIGATLLDMIASSRGDDNPGSAHYRENVYPGTLEYDNWWYRRALADGYRAPGGGHEGPTDLNFNPTPSDGTPFTSEGDIQAILPDQEPTAEQLLGMVPGLPMRRHLSAELDELYEVQQQLEDLAHQWYRLNWEYENSGWRPSALGTPTDGRGLNAHEVTHVTQQGSGGTGGLRPTGDTRSLMSSQPDEPPAGASDFAVEDDGEGTPPGLEFEGGFTAIPTDETSRRRAILTEMVELMKVGVEAGCLDPGVTPCDWSPAKLADRLLRSTTAQREEDYGVCQRVVNSIAIGSDQPSTNGLMSNMLGRTYRYLNSEGGTASTINVPSALMPAQLASLSHMMVECSEAVEADNLAIALADLRATTDLFDESTGRIGNPAWRHSRNVSMGNQYFGLDYAYDVGYEVDLSNGVCDAEAFVGGSFDTGLTVFGRSQSLLDVAAIFNSEEETNNDMLFDLHADVLGVPLFDPIVVEGGEPAEVQHWNRTVERSAPVGEISSTARFVVVFIPISIEAGAAAEVGFAADLGGWAHGFGQDECPQFHATGTFEPYLAAKGFVEAAINIGIAKAGVRGELTIIHMSVPVRASVGVTTDVQLGAQGEAPQLGDLELDAAQFDVDVNVDARLRLRTLDGRISAFAQTGFCPICARASIDIVNWKGPQYDRTLYREDWRFELDVLRRLLEDQQ